MLKVIRPKSEPGALALSPFPSSTWLHLFLCFTSGFLTSVYLHISSVLILLSLLYLSCVHTPVQHVQVKPLCGRTILRVSEGGVGRRSGEGATAVRRRRRIPRVITASALHRPNIISVWGLRGASQASYYRVMTAFHSLSLPSTPSCLCSCSLHTAWAVLRFC